MKKFVGEFREFAVKGNPFEMAFAVVVGGSFGLIVNSIAKDVLMPIFGYATSGVNFSDLKYILQEAYVNEAGAEIAEVAICYGKTIQSVISFAIISLSLFLMVKTFNAIKRLGDDPEETSVPTPKNIELLEKINKGIEKLNEKE